MIKIIKLWSVLMFIIFQNVPVCMTNQQKSDSNYKYGIWQQY